MIGGDDKVGPWPGYVTSTVYAAAKKLMGRFGLTFDEALTRLRNTERSSRSAWGLVAANSPRGRAMTGNAGGVQARVEGL
jgi:hypothetical protein